MKKTVLILIAIIFAASVSAQHTFKNEVQAQGGIKIGLNGTYSGRTFTVNPNSKIKLTDSITVDNLLTPTRFKLYSGATQLIPDVPIAGQVNLSTSVILQADTSSFAFGAGGKNITDTTSFTRNTDYGSFYNGGDTIIAREVIGGVSQGKNAPSIYVQIYFDDNLWDATPDSLLTNNLLINSTSGQSSSTTFRNSGVIPRNKWVWSQTARSVGTSGSLPKALRFTLLYSTINRTW